MSDFNSNSPTIRGAEWRPSSSRDLLLDATTKGVAMRFRGTAATYSHLHRFVSAVSGSPGLGIEVLSQLVPDGAGTFTARPNEDASLGSWTEDDGSTTTIYDQIDETTLDTADYIMQTGAAWTTAPYAFRVGIGSGNLAGKRIRALRMTSVLQKASGSVTSFRHSLNINGSGSRGMTSVVPDGTVQTFSSEWKANQSSASNGIVPWTIADAELFDTSDELEVSATRGVGSAEIRVYQAWMDFDYVTENRLGLLYTTGAPTLGWFEENISDAALSASTYYYVHVFPLSGSASHWFKVPLLKDPNVVMALNAAASTGEHRVAYSTTLDSGNGIITTATELPGEMIPMLFDVSGTIQAQSNPYCEID